MTTSGTVCASYIDPGQLPIIYRRDYIEGFFALRVSTFARYMNSTGDLCWKYVVLERHVDEDVEYITGALIVNDTLIYSYDTVIEA